MSINRLVVIYLLLMAVVYTDSASTLESALRIIDGTASSKDSLLIHNYDKKRFASYKVESKKSDGVTFGGLRDLSEGPSFLYGIVLDSRSGKLVSLKDSSLIQGRNTTHFNIAYKRGAKCYFIWFDEKSELSSYSFDNGSAPNNVVTGSISGGVSGVGFHDLYFIVSNNGLSELESLINKYERVKSANKSAAVRMASQIRSKLEEYIDPGKATRYANRLDRPVELGMAYRGEDDGVRQTSLTDLIEGNDIAIKRMTIEYR